MSKKRFITSLILIGIMMAICVINFICSPKDKGWLASIMLVISLAVTEWELYKARSKR